MSLVNLSSWLEEMREKGVIVEGQDVEDDCQNEEEDE